MDFIKRNPNEDLALKMGRIMLKYRPIAPKPLAPPRVALNPSPPTLTPKKRKGGGKRGRKSRKVTLPLMPVTPERKENPQPTWPLLPVISPHPVTGSAVTVTVENVTEVWSTEICVNDESADCPVFFSRSEDRVTWTNPAFAKLVFCGPESPSCSTNSYGSDDDVCVVLVTRGLVPSDTCRGFTCMTSVCYTCGTRGKVSLAVPCDVWRLEGGGLAWRLDLKAALRLSSGAVM